MNVEKTSLLKGLLFSKNPSSSSSGNVSKNDSVTDTVVSAPTVPVPVLPDYAGSSSLQQSYSLGIGVGDDGIISRNTGTPTRKSTMEGSDDFSSGGSPNRRRIQTDSTNPSQNNNLHQQQQQPHQHQTHQQQQQHQQNSDGPYQPWQQHTHQYETNNMQQPHNNFGMGMGGTIPGQQFATAGNPDLYSPDQYQHHHHHHQQQQGELNNSSNTGLNMSNFGSSHSYNPTTINNSNNINDVSSVNGMLGSNINHNEHMVGNNQPLYRDYMADHSFGGTNPLSNVNMNMSGGGNVNMNVFNGVNNDQGQGPPSLLSTSFQHHHHHPINNSQQQPTNPYQQQQQQHQQYPQDIMQQGQGHRHGQQANTMALNHSNISNNNNMNSISGVGYNFGYTDLHSDSTQRKQDHHQQHQQQQQHQHLQHQSHHLQQFQQQQQVMPSLIGGQQIMLGQQGNNGGIPQQQHQHDHQQQSHGLHNSGHHGPPINSMLGRDNGSMGSHTPGGQGGSMRSHVNGMAPVIGMGIGGGIMPPMIPSHFQQAFVQSAAANNQRQQLMTGSDGSSSSGSVGGNGPADDQRNFLGVLGGSAQGQNNGGKMTLGDGGSGTVGRFGMHQPLSDPSMSGYGHTGSGMEGGGGNVGGAIDASGNGVTSANDATMLSRALGGLQLQQRSNAGQGVMSSNGGGSSEGGQIIGMNGNADGSDHSPQKAQALLSMLRGTGQGPDNNNNNNNNSSSNPSNVSPFPPMMMMMSGNVAMGNSGGDLGGMMGGLLHGGMVYPNNINDMSSLSMMTMTGQAKQQITGQQQHQLHQSMLMMSPPPKQQQQQQQQQSLMVEGGNSTAGTPAAPSQKKPGLYRYTRNQDGILFIGIPGSKRGRPSHSDDIIYDSDGAVVRPSGAMTVVWQLPEKVFFDPENKDLCVGLVRYGSLSNSPCVVAKSLGQLACSGGSSGTVHTKDMFGNAIVKGRIPFHAPKAAGLFVYRLFDQSSKERMLITLGTSPMFSVEIQDHEVTSNLKFCFESFRDSSDIKGVTQLQSTVVGMCNSGKPVKKDHPQQLLQECTTYLLGLIQQGVSYLDARVAKLQELSEREEREKASIVIGAVNDAGGFLKKENDEENNHDGATFRQISRMQLETFDTIVALRANGITWSMLTDNQRVDVLRSEKLFCIIFNRFFDSEQSMAGGRLRELGFTPAPARDLGTLGDVGGDEGRNRQLAALDASITELLPTMMPATDFESKREAIRLRIEEALISSGSTPPRTHVALYGSSRNNFGSDDADMDMCLMLPLGHDISTEDRPMAIERLSQALETIGMHEVRPRATARIPIVQFVEPQSGSECDISFSNPLALCNTLLLRTYSDIDPRIRPLVYVIKRWAKARHINSPGDGTLSSYGYIICVLHYLQTRPVPLVPNLQRLPADWGGEQVFGGHNSQQQHMPEEHEFEINPADNSPCRTYFYKPKPHAANLLSSFASRNKETVAELLTEFFRYYGWLFDYRRNVVSLQNGAAVLKAKKAEADGWPQHERLSIEDPFETWYDVAHVIKPPQMAYIRKEFLRAHTLLSPASLAQIGPDKAIEMLCAAAEPPPFSAVAKEKAARDREAAGEEAMISNQY